MKPKTFEIRARTVRSVSSIKDLDCSLFEPVLDERGEFGKRTEAFGVDVDRADVVTDAEVCQEAFEHDGNAVLEINSRRIRLRGPVMPSRCVVFTRDSTARATVSPALSRQAAAACNMIASVSSTPKIQRSTPLNRVKTTASSGLPRSRAFAKAPSSLGMATAKRPRLTRSQSEPAREAGATGFRLRISFWIAASSSNTMVRSSGRYARD